MVHGSRQPARAWRRTLLGAVAWIVLAPASAAAHGDTIRVSYASVEPSRLTVKSGTTVHFHNANASGAPCTVVLGDGSVRSPTLGRAEGWHYTFERPGEMHFFVAEFPTLEGVVVVLPVTRAPPSSSPPPSTGEN